MHTAAIFVSGVALLLVSTPAIAVEPAPRITDREIVERLTRLEEGQKTIEVRIANLDQRIDDLRAEMTGRFDTLTWILSLFVTIALVILGFVVRMQWRLDQRQSRVETALTTQQDELAFVKSLIEKLLPPRATL